MRKKVDDRKLMLPEMGYLLKGSVVFLHQKLVHPIVYIAIFIIWEFKVGLYEGWYGVFFENYSWQPKYSRAQAEASQAELYQPPGG